jgi:hypothetical protein
MSKKSLFEYISENDQEYKIEVYILGNIEDQEISRRINTVLDRYGATEIQYYEEEGVRLPPQFPGVEFGFVSKIEATITILPESGIDAIADQISLETQFPSSSVCVEIDGMEAADAIGADVEEADDYKSVLASDYGDASSDHIDGCCDDMVGTGSISRIVRQMKEEEFDRIRDEQERVRKFTTTHLGLRELIGENHKKGYYSCSFENGRVVVESGPHTEKPSDLKLIKDKVDLKSAMAVLGENVIEDDLSPEDKKTDQDISISKNIKSILQQIEGFEDVKVMVESETQEATIDLRQVDVDELTLGLLNKVVRSVSADINTATLGGTYLSFKIHPKLIR